MKNSKNKSQKFRLFIWRVQKLYDEVTIRSSLTNNCHISYANESLFNYTTYSIIYSYISLTHDSMCTDTYHILLLFVIANANWQCNWRVLFELFTLINKLSFSKITFYYFFIFTLFWVRKLPMEMKFKLNRESPDFYTIK